MDPQKTPFNQPAEGDNAPAGPPTPTEPALPAQPESQPANPGFGSSEQVPAADNPFSPMPEAGQDGGPVVSGDVVPSPLPVGAPKSSKKGLIIGLVIAAVLLLLSGGAAASYYYVVNKPENVLKQALANSMSLEKARTSHFSGSVSFEQAGSGTPIEATYKGSGDSKTGAFELSGKVDLMVTNVTFDLLTEDSKSLFFRLGGLEGLPDLLASSGAEAAAYAPLVDSLNNQWIEINESLIKQYDPAYQSGVFTEADIKKITDAYLQDPFLVIDEVLANETVAGEDCYHYRLKVDPAKLKGFLAALKDAKLDSYKIEQETLDEYNKSIDDAKLGDYPFEIWISKGSKMFKQLELAFSSEGVDVKLTSKIDSYNKPVEVQKPEDAKSLMEIMGNFLTSGLDSGLTMPAEETNNGISL